MSETITKRHVEQMQMFEKIRSTVGAICVQSVTIKNGLSNTTLRKYEVTDKNLGNETLAKNPIMQVYVYKCEASIGKLFFSIVFSVADTAMKNNTDVVSYSLRRCASKVLHKFSRITIGNFDQVDVTTEFSYYLHTLYKEGLDF